MKIPVRAQNPAINFPNKVYQKNVEYLIIYGEDQTIFATQLWLEIVSDCCDCHETPPERLDKCPGVAGVGGVDGGQASAVQPPNLSSLLLCKVHEAVATLSNIAGLTLHHSSSFCENLNDELADSSP